MFAAKTNPAITTDAALKQCYDSGYRLAEYLSQGSEDVDGIKPQQVIFLSSPVERALSTAEEAIRGFTDYCE